MARLVDFFLFILVIPAHSSPLLFLPVIRPAYQLAKSKTLLSYSQKWSCGTLAGAGDNSTGKISWKLPGI